MPRNMCKTHIKLWNAKKKKIALGNITCHLHIFLGIIELRIENKNLSLDKTVLLLCSLWFLKWVVNWALNLLLFFYLKVQFLNLFKVIFQIIFFRLSKTKTLDLSIKSTPGYNFLPRLKHNKVICKIWIKFWKCKTAPATTGLLTKVNAMM